MVREKWEMDIITRKMFLEEARLCVHQLTAASSSSLAAAGWPSFITYSLFITIQAPSVPKHSLAPGPSIAAQWGCQCECCGCIGSGSSFLGLLPLDPDRPLSWQAHWMMPENVLMGIRRELGLAMFLSVSCPCELSADVLDFWVREHGSGQGPASNLHWGETS